MFLSFCLIWFNYGCTISLQMDFFNIWFEGVSSPWYSVGLFCLLELKLAVTLFLSPSLFLVLFVYGCAGSLQMDFSLSDLKGSSSWWFVGLLIIIKPAFAPFHVLFFALFFYFFPLELKKTYSNWYLFMDTLLMHIYLPISSTLVEIVQNYRILLVGFSNNNLSMHRNFFQRLVTWKDIQSIMIGVGDRRYLIKFGLVWSFWWFLCVSLWFRKTLFLRERQRLSSPDEEML